MPAPNKRLKTGSCPEVEVISSGEISSNFPSPPQDENDVIPATTTTKPPAVRKTQDIATNANTITISMSGTKRDVLVEPSENAYYGKEVNHGLDMEDIDRNMFFTPSERQTVSCGAASVDLRRGRILSMFNKKLGIAQLPKGRKQIGEGQLDAALRETLEESGIAVKPLALKVATRATRLDETKEQAAAGSGSGGGGGGGEGGKKEDVVNGNKNKPPPPPRVPDKDVTTDVLNNEFIGVVRYPDPQSQTAGTLKSIYWYAATFDLDDVLALGDQRRGEDKFVVCAYGVRDTIDHLRFEAERDVVRKLVADLEASGIEMAPDPSTGSLTSGSDL